MPDTARSILPLSRIAPVTPAPRPTGKPWGAHELAAFLSVSTQTIGKLVKAGRLQRLPLGRRLIVTDESVRTLLNAPHGAPAGSAGQESGPALEVVRFT